MSDMVHHPDHYCNGGIECIDAIRASMTADCIVPEDLHCAEGKRKENE